MQPVKSSMHDCIERLSKVIQKHCTIMVMEAAMNNAIYPFHARYLGKSPQASSFLDKFLQHATPLAMALTPEPIRRPILRSVRSIYDPVEINTGCHSTNIRLASSPTANMRFVPD